MKGAARAACYIDERADDAPARRADAGRARRLRRAVGPLHQDLRTGGARRRPFDVQLAEHGSRARIGDVVKLELEPIRNPVTQAEVHPEVVLPEGLVVKRGGMARSSVFQVSDLGYDHSGRYAAFGRFDYT